MGLGALRASRPTARVIGDCRDRLTPGPENARDGPDGPFADPDRRKPKGLCMK